MFTATFYRNISDTNVIRKDISHIKDTTVTPTNTVNILSPVLTVDYDVDLISSNYCYISAFSRYYYIKNISLQIGKKLLIECYVDVLMTYENDIYNTLVNVCRAENPVNRDLADDKIQINPKTYFIETNQFPNNPYTTGGNQYVIGVNGTEVLTP